MTNPTGDQDPEKQTGASPESPEPPPPPPSPAAGDTRVINTGPGGAYPPPGGPPSYGTPPPAGGYDSTWVNPQPSTPQPSTPPPSYGAPSAPSYGSPNYGTPEYGSSGGTPTYGSDAPGASYGAYEGPGDATSDPNVPPAYGAPAAPYGQPGYGAAGYPPVGAAAPKTNGLAIASLVTGILGCCGLLAIVGIVLGFVARNQIKQSNGTQSGDGLALAGIICGAVWLAANIVYGILRVAIGLG